MTEENGELDTGIATQNPDDAGSSADEAGTDADEGFLGRWKTREDAQQGVLEQDRKITEQGQTLSEMKAQMASLQEKSDLASAIARLAESNQKSEQSEAVDLDSFAETLAQKSVEDPGEAMKLLTKTFAGWSLKDKKEMESLVASKYDQVLKEIKALREDQEKLSPEYQQYRETIDGLVADGMPMAKAKEWAKKMQSEAGANQPGRIQPPSDMGGSRVSSGGAKKATYFANDAEWENFKAIGELEDSDRAIIEADYLKNKGGAK